MAKSKGFKPRSAEGSVTITFAEGHRLHGIEVEVERRIPIGVVIGATAGDFSKALRPFVKRITAWNLVDDDGQPITVSMEAFEEQFDAAEAGALLTAWVEVATQPSVPLGQP